MGNAKRTARRIIKVAGDPLRGDQRDDSRARLEYLRGELRAERISTGELVELQSLVKHISSGDVELLEAAGVPEKASRPPLVNPEDHPAECEGCDKTLPAGMDPIAEGWIVGHKDGEFLCKECNEGTGQSLAPPGQEVGWTLDDPHAR